MHYPFSDVDGSMQSLLFSFDGILDDNGRTDAAQAVAQTPQIISAVGAQLLGALIVIVIVPGFRCFDAPTTPSIDRSIDR